MTADASNMTIFGQHETRTVQQLARCVAAEEGARGVLCADGHVGYSQPIGGAVAYRDHISPSGVGYDIACIAAGALVSSGDGWCAPIETVGADATVAAFDGHIVRPVNPVLGAVERGERDVIELRLTNGRTLRATGDHEIRTKLGWRAVDELHPGDQVACAPFVGLPHEDDDRVLAIDVDPWAGRDLARRGLLPLRTGDRRFPALLRVLAYATGDGHLSRDGKAVSFYTVDPYDAADLRADLRTLGFRPSVYVRERHVGRRREHCVRVASHALHAVLAGLGSPVGRKLDSWDPDRFEWIFDLPGWMRAHFLSAFASAEATTPSMINGRVANVAIKQAGRTPVAAAFVVRVLASLGFMASITESGSAYKGIQTWVVQVLGGAEGQLRFFEQVGFCRARGKRIAAAGVASSAWQRATVVARREAAIADARALAAEGRDSLAQMKETISLAYGVSPSFVHHAIYDERPYVRAPKGARFDADHTGDVAWVPIETKRTAGRADVFDIATGDPAQAFQCEGIVVHNCGNKAVRTDLMVDDVRPSVSRFADEIAQRISFGMGRANDEPVGHPVLDRIRDAPFAPQRTLADLAAKQLGTVGGGNHYVDLFAGDDGAVWVGVHFGSRGFGHKSASGFLALAQGREFTDRAAETGMDSDPVVFAIDAELGQSYVEAMTLAGEYAYAGRDVVVDKVLEILGATSTYEVHNHHNFAWRESHDGEDWWVVRKGCTPAWPGQAGFVGSSMGEDSVILEGTAGAERALYSTVHGAGRRLSRTQAKGKWKKGRQVKPGVVDFERVKGQLAERGIELRGGDADEAPPAYKRLDEVLAEHAGTIDVTRRLAPLAVVMAGPDIYDPFRD